MPCEETLNPEPQTLVFLRLAYNLAPGGDNVGFLSRAWIWSFVQLLGSPVVPFPFLVRGSRLKQPGQRMRALMIIGYWATKIALTSKSR